MPRPTHDTTKDRNFDDLAHRFKRNVYDQLKGDIRLEVLQRDFAEFHLGAYRGKKLLDAGGGQGQFSLELANSGCDVDLCDISSEMIALAEQRVTAMDLAGRVSLFNESIQNFTSNRENHYDMVLCHAVLEWVVEPEVILEKLVSCLKPGGLLSITFYNQHSLVIKNLLRTNFSKVLNEEYTGYRGSLTPTFPRDPQLVNDWLNKLPLQHLCSSGIRCFHDYLLDPEERVAQPDQQLALELRLRRQEPYRSMARYIHVLSRKSLA